MLAVLVGLGALGANGCAGETLERPAREPTTRTAESSPLPLPLPDTAFRDDERKSASPPPGTSRFDTRRIGASHDGDDERSASNRFRGAPVDLDLKSADLGNAFRLLADVGHVNIVVGGEVTGTVTLRLKHVPWDQALDLVARTHGLELHREGNVILVRKPDLPLRL